MLRLLTPYDSDPSADAPPGPLLPRIGQRGLETSLARLASLERAGFHSLNPAAAVRRAKDRAWLTLHSGLPRPAARMTAVSDPPPLGFPFVVKPLRGSRGEGVRLVRRPGHWQELAAISPWIVEEFLDPAARQEWRILVLSGRMLAAVRRWPATGDFRSNAHLGGQGRSAEPPAGVRQLASEAARRAGLGLAGVDVIETRDAAVVVDLNDSPGLVATARLVGRDLAEDFLAAWLDSPGP